MSNRVAPHPLSKSPGMFDFVVIHHRGESLGMLIFDVLREIRVACKTTEPWSTSMETSENAHFPSATLRDQTSILLLPPFLR